MQELEAFSHGITKVGSREVPWFPIDINDFDHIGKRLLSKIEKPLSFPQIIEERFKISVFLFFLLVTSRFRICIKSSIRASSLLAVFPAKYLSLIHL